MIGVFDSGLGGLTAVKELQKLMPYEDIAYFGDTGRVPYGTRSRETIIQYAIQDVRFLLTRKVSRILIACGTVSSTALDALRSEFDIPILGVVEAAVEKALSETKNGNIAVIGTSATIKSAAYERAILKRNSGIKITARACPLFVPLVENGFIEGDIPRLTAEHYLKDIRNSGADTIILGCTHYPILAKVISEVLPGVTLVSAGAEAARSLHNMMKNELADGGKCGVTEYYVSDSTESFLATAEAFLQTPVRGNVTQININSF